MPKDTLIYAVWPNDYQAAGISDERLAQLVKRLRDKIEPPPPTRSTFRQCGAEDIGWYSREKLDLLN
ncbi:MAG: helix-turn-helix domain-containing protein [Anaerolineales bacterium]|nr:helix-turn-helix domain-containing protein [Anaerolineales bacterium]